MFYVVGRLYILIEYSIKTSFLVLMIQDKQDKQQLSYQLSSKPLYNAVKNSIPSHYLLPK